MGEEEQRDILTPCPSVSFELFFSFLGFFSFFNLFTFLKVRDLEVVGLNARRADASAQS